MISQIQYGENTSDIRAGHIPYGQVDSTSTSTAFTATVPGITELTDGTICYIKNAQVTSATGFTLNVNGLGAKPVYTNLAAATAETTKFNINYTMLFIYNSSRVTGGCWDCYNGYNSDTTTARGIVDYYFRPYAGQATYRYKFLMEGTDGRLYPIVTTNQADTTQVTKSPTTTKLKPWKIWYYGATPTISSGKAFGAQTVYPEMYATTAVYNFNASTGTYAWIFLVGDYDKDKDEFTLLSGSNYYKFVPFSSAITWSSQLTTGKYYLLLGASYSTTNYVQLFQVNPFYYFDGTNLIPVPNKLNSDLSTRIEEVASSIPTVPSAGNNATSVSTTSSGGSATTYSRSDHVHDLTSTAVTSALGYTPYNSTNPNGYVTSSGVTSVRVQATSPVVSSTNTAVTTTLNTTISLADAYGDTKNPYGTKDANYVLAGPTTGTSASPGFRALVADDIPSLPSSKITGLGTAATVNFTTTVTDGSSQLPTGDAVHDYVESAISTALGDLGSAMVFKGTLGTGGDVTTLPTTGVKTGWTYRVITAGTYGGKTCEVGDLIIATSDGPTPTWTVAQTNITGFDTVTVSQISQTTSTKKAVSSFNATF